jgi:prolyl-tRNA editing enzyme YbaK/EbsC (Cys-tRNA(Pro) deacylase)
MDPDLGRYPIVWAAAGTPSAVFPVSPATLRTLANATVAPVAEERPPADETPESSSTPAE